MAKVVKEANGAEVSVSTFIGGAAGAVAWTSTAESLAELEKGTATLMASAEYHSMLKKAEGLIVPGTTHDQLWRHI
jgi:glycerate-2-kinase